MNELTVELFAPGKWNNMTFDADDLKDMAKNFGLLKDVHFAPIKLGHNDEQQITDGLPALGEITEVWYTDKGKDGKPKLMGKLAGLPEVVFNAVQKRRYNKLSIELDIGVQHKGRFMKYVLTAVALLGADIPAVNTLADLNAYMSRTSLFTDSKSKVHFTKDFTITSIQEDNHMDYEKLYHELQTKFAKLEADLATTAAEVTTLKATNAEFSRKDDERKAQDKETAIKTKRDEVTAKFEKAVEDKIITPAQRDQFTKLLGVDDDDAVVRISADDIDGLLKESGGTMFSKSQSRNKNDDERFEKDAGTELTAKAYEIMNSNQGMEFTAAFDRAMKAHPDLAKEHLANESTAA